MDDLDLPDPSDPTEEVQRPRPSATQRILSAWPFNPWETVSLVLLYASPFFVRWLVACGF